MQPDDPENTKLLTLARAARSRTRAAEGAAVRDLDGRTYAAATVALASLDLSAIALAVSMAASSGATGIEAVALVGEAHTAGADDLAVVRDLGGPGVEVLVADAHGDLRTTVRT